jgi:hypothetical protein
MELNLATDSRARDAWVRAPWDPSQGINAGSYSPAGGAQLDEMPVRTWRMNKMEPDRRDHLLRQDDGSQHGHLDDHIRGCSGHEYADACEHFRHCPWDWHKAGDHQLDWDYDWRDHREFAPCSSPQLPSMSDLQLFWMESALSLAARDWHGGYQGLLTNGIQ